jgi:DNA-binding transcriptional ArsR family regulator
MREPENEGLQPLAEIDRIVHEPARLMILATLNAVDTADFIFVERQTGLTRGNLSSHMSKLEQAKYLEIKKEFVDKIPRTLLRITDKGRNALTSYKKDMQSLLDNMDGDSEPM